MTKPITAAELEAQCIPGMRQLEGSTLEVGALTQHEVTVRYEPGRTPEELLRESVERVRYMPACKCPMCQPGLERGPRLERETIV